MPFISLIFFISEVPDKLCQINLFLIADPADMLIRKTAPDGSLHYTHFPDGYFKTSNCRTPTTPTMISSIPVLYSWKIWIAPSCAICVDPLDKLLSSSWYRPGVLLQNAPAQRSGSLHMQTALSAVQQRIADGENARIKYADDISGIGFLHRSFGRYAIICCGWERRITSCRPGHGRLPYPASNLPEQILINAILSRCALFIFA